MLNSKEDVLCGIVYIPQEGSKYDIRHLIVFLELQEELISITKESKCICLMGDFNARVGHLKDYFVSDEFLAH